MSDTFNEYIAKKDHYQYIHKRGKNDWVVVQKSTGKVLSHHTSKKKAIASFRAMMMNKHGSSFIDPGAEIAYQRLHDTVHGHVERTLQKIHPQAEHLLGLSQMAEHGIGSLSPEETHELGHYHQIGHAAGVIAHSHGLSSMLLSATPEQIREHFRAGQEAGAIDSDANLDDEDLSSLHNIHRVGLHKAWHEFRSTILNKCHPALARLSGVDLCTLPKFETTEGFEDHCPVCEHFGEDPRRMDRVAQGFEF